MVTMVCRQLGRRQTIAYPFAANETNRYPGGVMISYADFEFAIARWKARAAGIPQPAAPAISGAVAAPMLVSTAPEDPEEAGDPSQQQASAYVAEEAINNPSGLVIASDAEAMAEDQGFDPEQQ
jgi:hypothetical protein